MKRRFLVLLTATLMAAPTVGLAGNVRTLSAVVDAAELESVLLEVGVGDVEIVIGDDSSVQVEVHLKPRRGGIFSSLKKAERQVERATLMAQTSGSDLELKITNVSGDRRFEEDWTLLMPARLAVNLEHGVGDAIITGMKNDIDIDLGVGNATISSASGSIFAEIGVGELTVQAPASLYGDVEASSGVGSVRITVGDERLTGEGFVGHSAEWRGDGPHRISANTGVGDVIVKLD